LIKPIININGEESNREIKENLNFWEKALTIYHLKVERFDNNLLSINKVLPIYKFFIYFQGWNNNPNIDIRGFNFVYTQMLNNKTSIPLNKEIIELLFIFKRRFYSIFELNYTYLLDIDKTFLKLEIKRYTDFFKYLFNFLEKNGKYEYMIFFIIFFMKFKLKKNIDILKSRIIYYKDIEKIYFELRELFTILDRLLSIKILPMEDKYINRKQYLFYYLNPLREELGKKLFTIYQLTGNIGESEH
jgi:hypothetical protein